MTTLNHDNDHGSNTSPIEYGDDVLDVRDIIARYEDLEGCASGELAIEESELLAILESLEGMGGDEQWRGVWYPITLIRDSYFTEYAQELAEDIGAINADATWPNNCIDWERATCELRMDYSSVEIGGITYWTR